ncbi:MAG: cbb3-type cytochrome c oxidase subunit I, partial [Haloferacaceae archaeon]
MAYVDDHPEREETAIEQAAADEDRTVFVDEYPFAAFISRLCFGVAFASLGIGGFFGLIQALHRTNVFRGFVSSTDYYTVLTGHGVLLALVFTIFFLVGIFNWGVTRSLDREPRSPWLTKLWFTLMFVGAAAAAVAILGGLVDAIPMSADVLYTFYAPMKAHPVFYAGLALFIVGSWVAGFDWFRSFWAWRSEHPDERIPLQTFMVLTTML